MLSYFGYGAQPTRAREEDVPVLARAPSGVTSKRAKVDDGDDPTASKLRAKDDDATQADDDLAVAYDSLLEMFDSEQKKFDVVLSELDADHAAAKATLVSSRDAAAEALVEKQRTFETSLGEIEVTLSGLLRARVEALYSSKISELGGTVAALERETAKAGVDLGILRRVYDDLLRKLEAQRVDHAHEVARIAREALGGEREKLEARQSLTTTGFATEVIEWREKIRDLLASIQAERDARRHGRERMAAAYAAEQREFREELRAQGEAEKTSRHVEVAQTRAALETEHSDRMVPIKSELEGWAGREREAAAELEASQNKLAETRQDAVDRKAALATRHATAERELVTALDAEAAVHVRQRVATHEAEKRRALADVDRADEAELLRIMDLRKRDEADLEGQVDRLRAKIAAMQERIAQEDAAAKRGVAMRHKAYAAEFHLKRAMIDGILGDAADDQATRCGGGDAAALEQASAPVPPSAANEASGGGSGEEDLDEVLLTLRGDASALREAVLELERSLASETRAHGARIGALKTQISLKEVQLREAREEKSKADRDNNKTNKGETTTTAPTLLLGSDEAPADDDLASFGSSMMVEWASIVAGLRPASSNVKKAPSTPPPLAAPKDAAAGGDRAAWASRIRVVEQELGAIEEELARSPQGEDRHASLLERHTVLEREAQVLMRLAEGVAESNDADADAAAAARKRVDDALLALATSRSSSSSSKRVAALKQSRAVDEGVDGEIRAMQLFVKTTTLSFNYHPINPNISAALAAVPVKFVDIHFPPRPYSLYGAASKQRDPSKGAAPERVIWRRASDLAEVFSNNKRPPAIFVGGIGPDDITQGKLGDCWLMCALSACAEFPALVEKLFLDSDPARGIYRVKTCQGGLWTQTTVDDFIPCGLEGEPIFSKATDGELWVPLLEKAFAKFSGSYSRLRGGFAAEGLMDLTGLPTFRFRFKHPLLRKRVESGAFFDRLVWADEQEALMCASTPGEDVFSEGKKYDVGASSSSPSKGLVPGHAYAVISAVQVNGQRLVRLRNPWGAFEWAGAWADADPRWTPAFKAEVAKAVGIPVGDVVKDDDGMFWMCYEDFITHFTAVAMSIQQPLSRKKLTKWREHRVRGTLTQHDPAELYTFTLKEPAYTFVGVHQADKRSVIAPDTYMDLGLTVVRRDGASNLKQQQQQQQQQHDLASFVSGSSPSMDREVFAPDLRTVDVGAVQPWPAGEYTICAYTTGRVFAEEKAGHSKAAWPPDWTAEVMNPVVVEIFERFNRDVDGMLTVGEEGEAARLLEALGLGSVADITQLMRFAHSRDGLTLQEIAAWFAARRDWAKLLAKLGYVPGSSPDAAPVLWRDRLIAVSVHTEAPIELRKVSDDPLAIKQAQEMPILADGTAIQYGDIDVVVKQAIQGASILVKNVSPTDLTVTVDASKSKNAVSHHGNLRAKMKVPSGQTLIFHHLTPDKPGPWGYTYEVEWT